MSDWGTWRQTPAAEAPGSWVRPESGPAAATPPPGTPGPVSPPNGAGSPWWSDALADPWRDPAAPTAVVVTHPTSGAPPLEQVGPPAGDVVRRGLGLVVLVSVITALLAGALGGTLGFVFASRSGVGRGPQLGADKPAPLTQRAPDSLAGVVKKVLPSVITVKVQSGGGTSLGSGFIVSTDGYAITNDHVVAGSSGPALATFSDGNTVTAKVVGSDPESDVAVLKLDATNLTPIQFGDSDSAQVGDPVLAIGSPLALANTVTYGIVSAVDRPIAAGEAGGPTRYYAAIQTDAAVNHGNSGGPLVDAAGRVIGINAVIKSLATDQEQAGNVGLAFAIPINQAKRIAQDIVSTGKARRTVIGAELDTSYHSASGGVRIQTVASGGPAASAGLRPGDVLTRFGGAQLEDPGDLIALVRKYAPGAGVSVEYTRDGARHNAQVVLAADGK